MAEKKKTRKSNTPSSKGKPDTSAAKKSSSKKRKSPDPYAGTNAAPVSPEERIRSELAAPEGPAPSGTVPPRDATPRQIGSGGGEIPISIISRFLDQMRGGILYTLALLFIFTIAGFFFSDRILHIINLPFIESGRKLNIFTVTGGFMIRVKASFGAAVLVVFPYFVNRIWRVVLPSISRETRMFSRLSVIAGVLLFYSGIAFVYFILMPAAVKILLDFIGGSMASTIGADDYLSFTIIFSLAMGVLFDTPIIVMLLTYFGLVTPKTLSRYRKHAIVGVWIIAALITPTPDPLTQSLVAVPLMVFYELSILGSRLVLRRKRKRMEEAEGG